MSVSQNGWPLSRNIRKYTVPGTNVTVWLNADAAPLLLRFMARWHREVEPIRQSRGVWGYAAPKRISGPRSSFSNHGSGSCVDINSADHPMGRRTFSAKQRTAIHKILADFGGTLRWGGDYRSTVDEMHTEVNASPAAVARQIKAMRLNPDGTVKPKWKPRPFPLKVTSAFGKYRENPAMTKAHRIANGTENAANHANVRLIQGWLTDCGARVPATGNYNQATHNAVKRMFGKHGRIGRIRWIALQKRARKARAKK